MSYKGVYSVQIKSEAGSLDFYDIEIAFGRVRDAEGRGEW